MNLLPADVQSFIAAPVTVTVPCFACEGHGMTASAVEGLNALYEAFLGGEYVEPPRTVECGACRGRGTWRIRPDGSLDDNGVTS